MRQVTKYKYMAQRDANRFGENEPDEEVHSMAEIMGIAPREDPELALKAILTKLTTRDFPAELLKAHPDWRSIRSGCRCLDMLITRYLQDIGVESKE